MGAGIIQGLDACDSNISPTGLYQALTYQSGLLGGAWSVSSIAGNNYPTISFLKENLWEQAFQDSLVVPNYLHFALAYGDVISNIIYSKRICWVSANPNRSMGAVALISAPERL
jgi:lysophospholipase